MEAAGAEHLDEVRDAYAYARTVQLEQSGMGWPPFPDARILAEIAAGQLHRLMDGDVLAGVVSVMHEDPLIWGDLERGAHLYLHRIARAPRYSRRGLADALFAWARARCRALGREGLRMDTWADNPKLIGLYERHGFHVVGHRRLFDERLPEHYQGVKLVLLEEGGSG